MRVGIVGLGAWGTRAHLPAFSSMPKVQVAAVVDQNESVAHATAKSFSIERVETDAEQLFSDPDNLDAIVIATPDDTHRDLVIAAFDAGLHVLCEKPLSHRLDQSIEMVAAADRSGLVARIGFLFRHSPVVQNMHQLVSDGFIGEVQFFEHIGINAQFADPTMPVHWKMQRQHANGGVFVEYGAHTIDLAIWFGGSIEQVVAHGLTLIPERSLPDGGRVAVKEDDVSAWIGEYASGGQALFRSGWASFPVGDSAMKVYGSEGSLLWQQHGRSSESLIAVTRDDPVDRKMLTFEPPLDPIDAAGKFPVGILYHYNRRLVESFVDDIRTGQQSGPNFHDGLAAQRVLAGIRTSLDEQRWVWCGE